MPGKVVVASGGRSLEREVSLRSGGRAADALGALGYDVTVIDPDAHFVRRIRELRPDFVFVAMHGRGGEDGTLQDLLEIAFAEAAERRATTRTFESVLISEHQRR